LAFPRAPQEADHAKALEQLKPLAVELDHEHPGAAASLREGMEDTLTVTRLGITGKLKRTLQSTNPCESMIGIVRAIQRNVKNWSSGEMCLRWTAAGMFEAETRFPRGRGLPRPRATRHPHRNRPHQTTPPTPHRVDTSHQCVTISDGTAAAADFHDGRGILCSRGKAGPWTSRS
jgi:putative transposase